MTKIDLFEQFLTETNQLNQQYFFLYILKVNIYYEPECYNDLWLFFKNDFSRI